MRALWLVLLLVSCSGGGEGEASAVPDSNPPASTPDAGVGGGALPAYCVTADIDGTCLKAPLTPGFLQLRKVQT